MRVYRSVIDGIKKRGGTGIDKKLTEEQLKTVKGLEKGIKKLNDEIAKESRAAVSKDSIDSMKKGPKVFTDFKNKMMGIQGLGERFDRYQRDAKRHWRRNGETRWNHS